MQEEFMAKVNDRLGSRVIPRELEYLGLENTPQYDPYDDETQIEQSFPQPAEKLQPMPNVGYYYKGAKIIWPMNMSWVDPIQIQYWI